MDEREARVADAIEAAIREDARSDRYDAPWVREERWPEDMLQVDGDLNLAFIARRVLEALDR